MARQLHAAKRDSSAGIASPLDKRVYAPNLKIGVDTPMYHAAASRGKHAARSALPPPRAPRLGSAHRRLLEAPIARTLVRLAAPNILVMLVQAGVGLIETWFVGRLGTAALAGMALA